MPRIGLLSDSHGQVGTTQRGARILAQHHAELLLHMGDIGATEVLDAMLVPSSDTGRPIDCRIVFGNTDWETHDLQRHATRHGMIVDHPAGTLTFGDKQLVYTHGHRSSILLDALDQGVSYFCHGHTHKRLDTHHGSTRIINPGALFRASCHTVALLDTDADTVEFYEIDR